MTLYDFFLRRGRTKCVEEKAEKGEIFNMYVCVVVLLENQDHLLSWRFFLYSSVCVCCLT